MKVPRDEVAKTKVHFWVPYVLQPGFETLGWAYSSGQL
jgi:hypothetical protein